MKTKLKIVIKVASVVIVGLIIASACKKSFETKPKLEYSEFDIARGVLFLDGPVADAIPQLSDAGQYIKAMVKSKLGEDGFVAAKKNQQSHIDEILKLTEKMNPGFLAGFKKNMTSKNPQEISEAIQSSNNLLYTAMLYKRYGSIYDRGQTKSKFNNIFFNGNTKMSILVRDIKQNTINVENIESQMTTIINDEFKTENQSFKENTPSLELLNKANEGACAAFNVGLFVNVAAFFNVIGLVNIELGFNISTGVSIATYTAFWSETKARSAAKTGLDAEMMSSSIADTL